MLYWAKIWCILLEEQSQCPRISFTGPTELKCSFPFRKTLHVQNKKITPVLKKLHHYWRWCRWHLEDLLCNPLLCTTLICNTLLWHTLLLNTELCLLTVYWLYTFWTKPRGGHEGNKSSAVKYPTMHLTTLRTQYFLMFIESCIGWDWLLLAR